jgi:hypothetical protein
VRPESSSNNTKKQQHGNYQLCMSTCPVTAAQTALHCTALLYCGMSAHTYNVLVQLPDALTGHVATFKTSALLLSWTTVRSGVILAVGSPDGSRLYSLQRPGKAAVTAATTCGLRMERLTTSAPCRCVLKQWFTWA